MVTFFRGGGYFLGSGQIYVRLLPDGESKQLTFDSKAKYDPVFTPDGSRVAYTGLSFNGPYLGYLDRARPGRAAHAPDGERRGPQLDRAGPRPVFRDSWPEPSCTWAS